MTPCPFVRRCLTILALAAALGGLAVGDAQAQRARGGEGRSAPLERKQVLAWADIRHGAEHESVTRALVTIERLGRESGLFDTYIRTDSQLITKGLVTAAATGQRVSRKNLDYFDAIFFFGVREIDLSPQQRTDLLSFVRDDGKGFVATHTATTAFFSWPEFGEMIGGRYDGHPWGVSDATVLIEDPDFPAMRGLTLRWRVRVQTLYLEAMKWAFGLVPGLTTPRPLPAGASSPAR